MAAAATARLRTLTWLLPLNTTPLRLATITVPSALIWPWIWLGRALGSLTRLSTAQLLCWSNCRVVCRPMLKVSQLRIARSAVCSTVTVVRPSACDCTGALAFCQACSKGREASTFRPPSPRPSGMSVGAASAAWRPAAWAACCAAMAATVLLRFCSERCNCWLTFCCWASGGGVMPGNCALGRAAPALCWAPLAANQAALNGWEAWAPPATMSKAMICASGFSRGKPPSSETVTGDDGTNGRDGMTRDSLGVFNSTRRLANAHS